jgi:hypothetical protein
MPFRTEILFSAPTPDDEMERIGILSKVLPKVAELLSHIKDAGLDATLTIKTVNSVPRPRGRRQIDGRLVPRMVDELPGSSQAAE